MQAGEYVKFLKSICRISLCASALLEVMSARKRIDDGFFMMNFLRDDRISPIVYIEAFERRK